MVQIGLPTYLLKDFIKILLGRLHGRADERLHIDGGEHLGVMWVW